MTIPFVRSPGFPRSAALAAKQALDQLDSALANAPESATARLSLGAADGQTVEVPVAALRFLHDMASSLAAGESEASSLADVELTTQQAAEYLKVSRPFVVKLLDQGEIAHRLVGAHRRVRLGDLREYDRKSRRVGAEALDSLTAQAQELGLY